MRSFREVMAVSAWLSLSFAPACDEAQAEPAIAESLRLLAGHRQIEGFAGDLVTVRFEIRNSTGRPQELTEFRPSCTCQSLELDGERLRRDSRVQVSHGHAKVLLVRIQLPAGEKTTSVSIGTNDGAGPDLHAVVKSTAKPRFAFEPPGLRLGVVARAAQSFRTVLRSNEGSPFSIDGCSRDDVVQSIERQPDGSYVIRGSITPQREGPFLEQIDFSIDGGRRSARFMILGEVQRSVRVKPSLLLLGRIAHGGRCSRQLEVQVARPDVRIVEARIEGCRIGEPDIACEVDGLEVRLVVRSAKTRGPLSGTIVLTFSNDVPNQRVRFMGFVTPS